jgi:acyl-CoA thioester hydrolase
MGQKVFHFTHRVSYADCTVGNHVYHSRFLEILERARGEFFRSLGGSLLDWQEQDVIFPVMACGMKFRAMARYDDLLGVRLWVAGLGRARFACASEIHNASGTLLHEAVIDVVCTTIEGRPRRLPSPLFAALQGYLTPAAGAETSP